MRPPVKNLREEPSWAWGAVVLVTAGCGSVEQPVPVPPPLMMRVTTSEPASVLASDATLNTTLTRDADGCAGVRGTAWHPLSGVDYTGRLRITLPARAGGTLVLFIGDSVPLDVEAETVTGAPIVVARERLQAGPAAAVPPDFWLEDQSPWNAPREIVRVAVDARAVGDLVFVLRLGRRAPRVLARLTGYPPEAAATVCAQPLAAGERDFTTGWYPEETAPEGPVRWMRGHGAVLVHSPDGRQTRVRIRAAPAVAGGVESPTTVTLRVNDVFDLPPVAMRAGYADYEWLVPDAAWVPGANELLFTVSRVEQRGPRLLGLALASLHAQ